MLRATVVALATVLAAPLGPQGCPFIGGSDDDTEPTPRGTIPTTAEASPARAETGQLITLRASADPGPDGATVHYSWLQTAGVGAALRDADQATARVTAPSVPQDQALRFVVTTRNDAGDVGRAEVAVLVAADPNYGQYVPNTGGGGGGTPAGPVADAGRDREVVAGDAVVLDGSASTGQTLTYDWRQVGGRAVALTGAATAEARFTAPAYDPDGGNVYTFRLRVTDSRGRSATDQVAITVLNPAEVGPRVRMETTFGTIVIELYEDEAPITVENFLRYVDEGFYSNTLFHRVIPGFVIQGGGYTVGLNEKETHDPIVNESDNGLKNLRGTIAMARTNDPDSATSQFYFNLADNAHLDRTETNAGYAVFGRVFEGLDVLDRIAAVETTSRSGFDDVPVQDILIRSVTRITAGG